MTRMATLMAAALAASVQLSGQAPAKGPQPPAGRSAQVPLGPNQWLVDGGHSAASFSVRHLMVATVRGQLGPMTGMVEYDGKDVRSVKADVTIDVRAINTQNTQRDQDLRGADFFDTGKYPTITFKSKRVDPGADGAFKLIGDLTIRGTTREVTLDVEAPAPVTKGMRGMVTGTTATTRIKRLEYGLKYNSMVEAGPVVGDEVTITIDIEIGRPSPPGIVQ
jgi:polyisoprenoid-binding protein YceI